jgi:hypothetical protein
MHAAVDAERRRRGLTWKQVAHAELYRQHADEPRKESAGRLSSGRRSTRLETAGRDEM